MNFDIVRTFLASRPWFVAAVGYLFTGLLVAIFHARSAEEYASRPPRVAALFKLLAGVGCDAPKAWTSLLEIMLAGTPKARAMGLGSLVAAFTFDVPKIGEAVYQIITGTRREDGPNPPGGTLAAVTMAVALGACSPRADVPRETARGTILTLAEGVHRADLACAELARARHDAPLATTCADAYDAARDALLGAESAVDAWDAGKAGDVACASVHAVASLHLMSSAIRAAGGAVPPVVDDALRLAPTLAGVCHG